MTAQPVDLIGTLATIAEEYRAALEDAMAVVVENLEQLKAAQKLNPDDTTNNALVMVDEQQAADLRQRMGRIDTALTIWREIGAAVEPISYDPNPEPDFGARMVDHGQGIIHADNPPDLSGAGQGIGDPITTPVTVETAQKAYDDLSPFWKDHLKNVGVKRPGEDQER